MAPLERTKSEVVEFLENLGACQRCAIRFTFERDSKAYVKDIAKDLNHEEPAEKLVRISPCIICLGIIQKSSTNDDFIELVSTQVQEAGYDSPTFSCMLSIPVSIMLREQAAWFLLQEKFPEFFSASRTIEQVTALKDVWKFMFTELLQEKLGKTFEYNSSPFQINVNICYKDDQLECSPLVNLSPSTFKHRYNQTRVYKDGIFTRNAVQSVLAQTAASKFFEYYKLHTPKESFYYGESQFIHSSIYVAGRYNKYSRNLCQTPWVVDGAKHMETSTQELICDHILPFFKAENCKFASSGREDVDVRTLGKGRPFALEILNPHRIIATQNELSDLQLKINGSTDMISVRDLQLVTKDQLGPLKEGEEEKTKVYSALCVTLDGSHFTSEDIEKINNISQIVINQKTPLRVLHRRPLAVRPRTIYELRARNTEKPDHIVLHLKTQAGTYIKEFVHGDFNRTTPNICTILGKPVDIVALDVDAVELDWPPPVDVKQLTQ